MKWRRNEPKRDGEREKRKAHVYRRVFLFLLAKLIYSFLVEFGEWKVNSSLIKSYRHGIFILLCRNQAPSLIHLWSGSLNSFAFHSILFCCIWIECIIGRWVSWRLHVAVHSPWDWKCYAMNIVFIEFIVGRTILIHSPNERFVSASLVCHQTDNKM